MYLTVSEVAKHYRVSDDTIRRWIKEKRIASINIGTSKLARYRIPQDAVLVKRFAKPEREIIK
jgi:excisionase family DNA binding protein